MNRRTRQDYSEQFKADAVDLVEKQGYGITEAAQRLGINRSNVERWRRERRSGEHGSLGERERERELVELREEVRKLRTEREILKKAAAFFAKESS